eukprot:TRINITY_DN26652_c0_g1_i1.p1 TRINITY_DN26652_c0_g1~~TRINITY_DN26652_c0_g1_i1.p1  ORF type:complete len:252 (+),score=41.38 TRINITY_DN26652_c0_g1_i1:72-827(+)
MHQPIPQSPGTGGSYTSAGPASTGYMTSAAPVGVIQPGEPGFFLPNWILEERRVVPMVCMGWWGLSILITLINCVGWIMRGGGKTAYGDGFARVYLTFVIIGMIVYFSVSSTFWFWAAKYSTERVDRKRKTITGIVALWFLNDMPLWAMDYHSIEVDAARGIQIASFIFNTITFLTGGIVVWLTYTYKVTTFLNNNYTPISRPEHSAAHSGSVFPERGGGMDPILPQQPLIDREPMIMPQKLMYHRTDYDV